MKVAVCTSNGNEVDIHFGRTENFYIYEVENSNIAQLEIRSTEKYCAGYSSPDHEFQYDKLNNIFETIKDCEVLFTVKIGEAPKAALEYKGIKIIECEAVVSKLPELI
jgi:predicted Fe-Mo cluster-binding NifX family protein